jgi:hypothetical protein
MNVATVAVVKAHLRLVAKIEPRHRNLFVDWLVMRLSSVDTSDKALKDSNHAALDAEAVDQIRTYLAAQFKHVIDLSYGGDAKDLQATHDGKLPPWTGHSPHSPIVHGTPYRC